MDKDNKYGMYDMHVELLNMLSAFNKICKENSINYSLGYGSMLGAVREHGIIPWDDDVDIIIDRDNYQKLEAVLDNSPLFVLERDTKKTMWVPIVQYRINKHSYNGLELTIDVFLIDNVPNAGVVAKTKLFIVLFLQGMIKSDLNIKKGNGFQRLASIITFILGRLLPLSFKSYLYKRVSVWSNNKLTKYCSCYNAEYSYAGRRYDYRLLNELLEMDFDGIQIPVSKYYESYLTTLYGDYKKPPVVEARKPKHMYK